MAEIFVQCQSLSIVLVSTVKDKPVKEWAKISCFYFDIKNNIVVLWIKNFIWDTIF